MTRTSLIVLFVLSLMSCKSKIKENEQTSIKESLEDKIAFWVGTYTRKEGHVDGKAPGAYFGYLNPETGEIRMNNSIPTGANPSYLAIHPNQMFLYAVNETGGTETEKYGMVQAFRITSGGDAVLLNQLSSKGIAPCHISTNRSGTHVFVANYVSGNLIVYPINNDGSLADPVNEVQFTGHGIHPRQEGPHAHQILEGPDNRIYATDLGTDTVHIFQWKDNKLQRQSHLTSQSGSGPRHLVFGKNSHHIYLLNELSGTLEVFAPNDEGYQRIQVISSLEEGSSGEAHSAHIAIHPNGKYIYASNRAAHNNIGIFQIEKDGRLQLLGHQPAGGKIPRSFAIDPNGNFLVVANQNSDNLVSFRINQEDGSLEKLSENLEFLTPVCLTFMSASH